MKSGDLQFVLEEIPHRYFKRKEADLIFTSHIDLRQALVGIRLHIKGVGNKSHDVAIRGRVITPSYTYKIKAAGMPVPDSKVLISHICISPLTKGGLWKHYCALYDRVPEQDTSPEAGDYQQSATGAYV